MGVFFPRFFFRKTGLLPYKPLIIFIFNALTASISASPVPRGICLSAIPWNPGWPRPSELQTWDREFNPPLSQEINVTLGDLQPRPQGLVVDIYLHLDQSESSWSEPYPRQLQIRDPDYDASLPLEKSFWSDWFGTTQESIHQVDLPIDPASTFNGEDHPRLVRAWASVAFPVQIGRVDFEPQKRSLITDQPLHPKIHEELQTRFGLNERNIFRACTNPQVFVYSLDKMPEIGETYKILGYQPAMGVFYDYFLKASPNMADPDIENNIIKKDTEKKRKE